jgi:hypothetical protein
MLNYFGTITQLSVERGVLEGVECAFCVKNYIDSRELWTDDDFEMIAVEVKDRNTKFTWEILGIYRARNDNMRVVEGLAARTAYTHTHIYLYIYI